MDAPNPFLIIPRAKKLLRYLGKTSYSFSLNEHGMSEIPVRDATYFHWNPPNPNILSVTAYNLNQFEAEDMVDKISAEVPLKGRPLETFFKKINEEAYEKAKTEYLHQAILNYLNSRLDQDEY